MKDTQLVYDPFRTGGGMRPNLNGTYKLPERFRCTAPDTLIDEWTIADPLGTRS
jgi:hypothetical protein